jgi:hypothetical protein
MRGNSVKDGWQRFLDRLRRLWGRPRDSGGWTQARGSSARVNVRIDTWIRGLLRG